MTELEFLSLREFRPPADAVAYRHRVWTAALGLLVIGGAALALLYIAWRGGVRFNARGDGIPPFIGWFGGGVLALFTRAVPYVFLRQRLKPSNWLVLRGNDGLFVKYRSYLNAHFPEADEQIVFLPYGAISAVRLHRRRWRVPSQRGGTRHQAATFIEMQLRDQGQVEALAARLAAERGNKGPRIKTWYGAKSLARYQDFPLQVTPEGNLAITWNVFPDAGQFLADIADRVEVVDAARTDYDWRNPSSAAEDVAEITTLGRMGDSFAVIRLLRRKFGLSLADAKTRNEEIRREP